MSPHASMVVEPSFKPLPPTPNNYSTLPPISTSSPSTASSPRIRRKPLPATAFSPQSILSSPISLRSDKDHYPQTIAPQPRAVLDDFLESPSRKSTAPCLDTLLTEPLHPQQSNSTSSTQGLSQDISIADFPLPPQNEGPSRKKSNESLHVPVKEQEDSDMRKTDRPPPLRMDSLTAVKAIDAKKPHSPGSVFTSFFSRKAASPQNISPSGESSATDISDTRSQSPYPGSNEENNYFVQQRQPVASNLQRQSSWQSSQGSINHGTLRRVDSGASGTIGLATNDLTARCSMLEAELKEISRELAGSIRRELDLEDLVERLQTEAPLAPMSIDRTSDYFSDSGTGSVRHQASEYSTKEEIDKIRREADQQRAQLKVELSQKWQNEVNQKRTLESHVQILETKLSQSRHNTNETSDASVRIRELEASLEDVRRRLVEERQTKENFEDLLAALRGELEHHRNERDNLRDEVVPNLKSQIDGLEFTFGDAQKQAYDFARMQQEIQSLRDENAAITSARKMEQEIIRSGLQHNTQDGNPPTQRLSLVVPKSVGLTRSNTVSARGGAAQSTFSPSGSLSRSNSILNRNLPDTPDNVNDRIAAVEQQRDALHSAVKYLRNRYQHQAKTHERKVQNLEAQIEKLNRTSEDCRRGGYEKEVRTLRQEINLLRKRADDALDQKWQCEKGLAGLKMDLDRSKQETASLQKLLQARGSDDPELLSSALEVALKDLQQTRARSHETVASLEHEQHIADQLAVSAERAESLALQVRQQLNANASLRTRLKDAVHNGEQNQYASASQISVLQSKLKKLEDTITTTQFQSETVVLSHEEEIKNLKASHNAQLLRAKAGIKSPGLRPGQASPISPMFAVRSPKLHNTTSGPGMSLNQALKTEFLEKKVAELEKALRDADQEMTEVVGRMNKAQIGVFELQQERDEAQKRTRKLESEIKAERQHFQALLANTTN